MPTDEQIQEELHRLEGEGKSDLRQTGDALTPDLLMMGGILLTIFGLLFSSQPLALASLALMAEYQAHSRAKFDTLVVFIPLAVFFVELWVQSR